MRYYKDLDDDIWIYSDDYSKVKICEHHYSDWGESDEHTFLINKQDWHLVQISEEDAILELI